ncbi:Uncharacterised protein [Vibrio cholerae]|uniref:Uncharacterized protein n=1 Tax=Vibrio cholerae TaxID=666 RepID=A0A655YPY6_VIBCL|nr:Uncharacterised protein [Vibrio cholerae]
MSITDFDTSTLDSIERFILSSKESSVSEIVSFIVRSRYSLVPCI